MIAQLLFAVCVAAGAGLFARRVAFIRKNILMGQDVDRFDRPSDRWKVMARVALGQGKMVARPVAGIMHILIYVGFVVINIELLEIVIDGLFGTHRAFAGLGGLYDVLIGTFEVLFESWTWGYLGLHDKPMGLLDTDGFYAPLLAFLDSTVSHGFLAQATRDMLLDAPTPSQLLDALEAELS